ncbi:MAG TPA: hypothetical protein EYG89_05555 [Bacteroidia bacterium]|nr:hypothetical protein [Bacteroidia bacterium]
MIALVKVSSHQNKTTSNKFFLSYHFKDRISIALSLNIFADDQNFTDHKKNNAHNNASATVVNRTSHAHSPKLSYHFLLKRFAIKPPIAHAAAQANSIATIHDQAANHSINTQAAMILSAKVAVHVQVKLLNQLSSERSNNKCQFISWYKSNISASSPVNPRSSASDHANQLSLSNWSSKLSFIQSKDSFIVLFNLSIKMFGSSSMSSLVISLVISIILKIAQIFIFSSNVSSLYGFVIPINLSKFILFSNSFHVFQDFLASFQKTVCASVIIQEGVFHFNFSSLTSILSIQFFSFIIFSKTPQGFCIT